MGWTTIKDKNLSKNKPELDDLFNSASESEVLKSVIIDNVYYAAVKNLKNNKTTAVVCLIKDNKDNASSSYKVMYEDECPNAAQAPKEIIELLSPTNNELSNQWRNNCIQNYSVKCK